MYKRNNRIDDVLTAQIYRSRVVERVGGHWLFEEFADLFSVEVLLACTFVSQKHA